MNVSGDTSNWQSWAKLIVNETKRFGQEIEKIDKEIKENAKLVSTIQIEIVKLSTQDGNELLKKDIELNKKEIERLADKIQSITKTIESIKDFKTQIITTITIVNGALAIGLALLAILK